MLHPWEREYTRLRLLESSFLKLATRLVRESKMSFVAKAFQRTVQLHRCSTSAIITPARSYATRLPQRPPPKVPDPLVNNPHATYTPLSDPNSKNALMFIHRPPPSVPAPESLTTSPSSPLLRPPSTTGTEPTSWTDPTLPPVSRPSLLNPKGPFPHMTDSDIEAMKELRTEHPAKWTRSKLAAKFGCSKTFVSLVAGLKKSEWKKKVRGMEKEHENVRSNWGVRKSMLRKVRARRREFW